MMIILVMIGNYIFSENCWFPAKLATWQHSHTLFSKLLALIFESAHTLFQWCELDFRNKGAPTCFPLPERKRFSRVWLDGCSAPSICGCGRVLPDSSGTWSHSFTQKINPQCVLARIDRFQPEGRWKPTVDLLTGKINADATLQKINVVWIITLESSAGCTQTDKTNQSVISSAYAIMYAWFKDTFVLIFYWLPPKLNTR